MMNWKKRWIDLIFLIVGVVAAAMVFSDTRLNALSAQEPVSGDNTDVSLLPRRPLIDSICPLIDFAVDSLCSIIDSTNSLDMFLNELDKLLAGKDTVVNIVHLGDSHVQAGFYSGQVMRMLQGAFGNAGRGWISPLKLAKINEPKDYYITSNIKSWEIGRCIQKTPPCPLGPGAMGIRTTSDDVDFTVSITPVNGAGYAFNRLMLYRESEAAPLLPDNEAIDVCFGDKDMASTNIAIDTFLLAEETSEIHLKAASTDSMAHHNCYYGFSLANGQPGVLYHAIGQNGAMFTNYTRPDYVRCLALLKPSLLIITLGTNESFAGSKFRTEQFIAQMDSFVRLVKADMPNTAIILTTPAESFRRIRRNTYERNRVIQTVATAIRNYAAREGIACFDLYAATGGDNSCEKWEKAKLLGRDRVHYSVEGYHEQGKLLSKALIRLTLNHQTIVADEN